MKLFAKAVVSAGLVVTAGAANAQMLVPSDAGRAHLQATSDFEGPYGAPPLPPAPAPRPYGYGSDNDYAPQYGYGPALMPLSEVYAVLRENGFSPLGIPQQRGFVYVISAIDRAGQDGRLLIDGRSGRIIRFTPAYHGGFYDRMHDEPGPTPLPYGVQAALPAFRGDVAASSPE
jgi:hypothetical protein